MLRNRILLAASAAAALMIAASGFAQDKTKTKAADEKKEPGKDAKSETKIEPEQVVSNLENPSGIAIQPKSGHIFIASRYGIYRYDPKDHKVALEIDTYPTDVYGKGTFETQTKFNIGPLGVAFMNDDHLVVGDGSRPDGEELVRVYKVESTPAEEDKYINEDKAAQTLGPIPKSEETNSGEGNFYGVAVGAGAIFVTCNGDDRKGWVARAEIKDGKAGKLELFIATKEATGVNGPTPAVFSPDGKLVVGQIGDMTKQGDSLLTIYDPKSGKLEKKYETGLSNITGIAYSPKTKKIYATDFGWADGLQKEAAKKTVGGLYELTIDGDKCTATKVVGLDHPAALTFDNDGKLYIALFGTKAADDKTDKSPGGLYVIDAGL